MEYKHKDWISEFNPRYSELSLLASEAAVDICNYRLKRREEEASVKYLAQLLDEITQGENPEVIHDLGIYSILFHAIPPERDKCDEYWQEYTKTRSRHVNEILLQTNLVAKDLRDFKSLPEERLKTLENFCVNLSQELMSHHSTYYSSKSRLVA